jgi:hypothetical protein
MAEQLRGFLGGAAMSSTIPPLQEADKGNEPEEACLDSWSSVSSASLVDPMF